MTKELQSLLDAARNVQMSPAEKEEQRRSFAYGNAKIENDLITKETIRRQAEKLDRKG